LDILAGPGRCHRPLTTTGDPDSNGPRFRLASGHIRAQRPERRGTPIQLTVNIGQVPGCPGQFHVSRTSLQADWLSPRPVLRFPSEPRQVPNRGGRTTRRSGQSQRRFRRITMSSCRPYGRSCGTKVATGNLQASPDKCEVVPAGPKPFLSD